MAGVEMVTKTGYSNIATDGDDSIKMPIKKDSNGVLLSYEDAASTYEHWSMQFMNPLFIKGYTEKGITHKDLGVVSNQDKSSKLYDDFWEQWLIEAKKPVKQRSLWKVLWRSVGYGKPAWGLLLYFIFCA